MPRKDKRAQILDAAEKLFKNKRYHEMTLDLVAKEAKVGKGTIYLYFKDKDDLVFQLALRGHDELCELIRNYTKLEDISFDELLEKVCNEISRFFLGRHALFRATGEHEMRLSAFREKRREEFNVHRRKLQSAIEEILAKGPVRKDIELSVQANFFLGMMRTRDHMFGGNETDMPPIKMLADIFMNGFGKNSNMVFPDKK
ncbi:MAG: hypothetical protein A2020_11855 [Lentisphaerae bacterium GWF2_45_14]|nr:MAG: hypothetical protein A2020_11855 [Lentisphaerae bacterium GWF2_45_14]